MGIAPRPAPGGVIPFVDGCFFVLDGCFDPLFLRPAYQPGSSSAPPPARSSTYRDGRFGGCIR